jgi:hypothetical protein
MVAPLALKIPPIWSLTPLALLIFLSGWAPAVALLLNRPQRAVSLAVLAAMVSYGGIFTLVLPRLEPLWISQRLEEQLPADAKLAAAGFHEPSLVFLHGTGTKLVDGGGAAAFLRDTPDGWAAIEAGADADFQQGLRQDGLTAEAVSEIDGFNYSRGRPAHIILWQRVRQRL